MKKVLLFLLIFICSLTIVYAQDEYVQKWNNDNISVEAIKHMIQTDDGLIVGGYDHDFVVQLAKYDHNGKEVKTLKLEYEGTVCGFFEKDGKYYFITTDDDNWWEVHIYEITVDLSIVRHMATGYHMEGWNEQVELVDNNLYITSTNFGSVDGVYDNDDTYYDYFYIDLKDFSTHHGNADEWNFDVFSKEKKDLIKLNSIGVPAIDVKEKDNMMIVGGKYSPYDDASGFIHFYEKSNTDITELYSNNSYVNKNELDVGNWYTHIVTLDEYIVAGGENYQALDFFNNKGEKVDTINLIKDLYDSDESKKYIQLEDMIYQDGRFSVAYQVCDVVDDFPKNCKSGIVVFQKKFKIETKTDGLGTVLAKTEEYGSEDVTLIIEPNEGYQIKEVKVMDKNGNVILVTDNKTFTMPFADVLIDVTFEPKNPETLSGVTMIIVFIASICAAYVIIINYRKLRWLR